MGWATFSEIKLALAGTLRRDPDTLGLTYDEPVLASIDTAREQIRNACSPFGYTEAQLVGWSSLHGFHRHQSLYWVEVELREWFKDNEPALLSRKDRLAELVTAITDTLTPDGDTSGSGCVGSGVLASRAAFDACRAADRARDGMTDCDAYRR